MQGLSIRSEQIPRTRHGSVLARRPVAMVAPAADLAAITRLMPPLLAPFPNVPAKESAGAFNEHCVTLDGASGRDLVPILIERAAREELAAVEHICDRAAGCPM